MKLPILLFLFSLSSAHATTDDNDDGKNSLSSLRGRNADTDSETHDYWSTFVDGGNSMTMPPALSPSPVTGLPTTAPTPNPTPCECNCPSVVPATPNPTGSPTKTPSHAPAEDCICSTPKPSTMTMDCPTPEPVQCPTPEPIKCPTPEPVICPSPIPVESPVVDCPVCPSAEPVICPTPAPVDSPNTDCPTPEPFVCPTPEPVTCPPPIVCPSLPPNDGGVVPTTPNSPLTNDNCAQAISLEINGSPIVGTTVNATTETRSDDVVYTFVGNGRTVRVSTCFSETTTAHNFLFRNGGCGSAAFGERSSDASCTGNPNAAAYEFDTVNGRNYPIIVYPRGVGVEGQFALHVTDYDNPPNDYCSQAIPLAVDGASVSGSTVNATSETRSDDVVYTFVGNGETVKVTTCFSETTTAHNFLFRNGGCGSGAFGETSGSSDCSENANAASYEFETVNGRTYPVIVYPRNPGEVGSFQIQVTRVPSN